MLENYKNTWTEAEIEQLLLLKDSKKTHVQIAEILGRTKASIDV
jgi:DNA-binding CsgD family transcriptional regulator